MVEPILKGPKFTEATKTLTPPEARATTPQEPTRKMTSLQIIKEVLRQEGDPAATKGFIDALGTNMKQGVTKLHQIGNTVFVVNLMDHNGNRMPPRTVEFYPMSIEPEMLAERFTVFPAYLKQINVAKAISYTDDPEDIQIMQRSGLPITTAQEMVYVEGGMTPMYRIELPVA